MAQNEDSPQLIHARREALFVLVLWCAAGAYTLGYCWFFAYGRSTADLHFILGFPDWVFWGILAPWSVCLVAGFWLALSYIEDDELREDEPSDLTLPKETTGAE